VGARDRESERAREPEGVGTGGGGGSGGLGVVRTMLLFRRALSFRSENGGTTSITNKILQRITRKWNFERSSRVCANGRSVKHWWQGGGRRLHTPCMYIQTYSIYIQTYVCTQHADQPGGTLAESEKNPQDLFPLFPPKRGLLKSPLSKPSKSALFGRTCLEPTSHDKLRVKLTRDAQRPLKPSFNFFTSSSDCKEFGEQ